MRAFCEKVKTSAQEAGFQLLSRKMSLSSSLDSQEGTRLDLREWLTSSLFKIRAKGCNNSQHYRKLLCMCWQWCANGCTTPNNVVTCSASWEGIQPIRPWVTCVPSNNNVERSGQTDPTMLGYTLAIIMEQKECWELFQTLHNNSQKHTTTCNRCANGCNRSHPTTLGVVGQQSCVRLHRAVDMAMEVSSSLCDNSAT